MNMLFRKCLYLFAATGCLAASVSAAELKVGDKFPALSQFKLDGNVPDKLSGKVVLVDFWASWCLPCKESFPTMEELQKNYGEKLAVIAVSVDEKKSDMESFVKQRPVSFAIVRDAEQKLVGFANVETMPTSYLLDAEGNVRFIHNGFHGKDTKKQYVAEIEQLLKASTK